MLWFFYGLGGCGDRAQKMIHGCLLTVSNVVKRVIPKLVSLVKAGIY